MSDVAVCVRDLGKRYRIGAMPSGYTTLRDSLASAARRLRSRQPVESVETIWALRHVSFDVRQGQVLGIIGRNGAGKSTLLKLLARVTDPTEGMAEIRGRIGSLLEVGTGFHPELSGRENIFLNGAILGMKRNEIARKFDEIVDFAEVERFIDTPVKRYSSGMYLRLAFAVAAHLEPEILVVDEVLAVGDAEFQRKCLGKMSDVAHEGRTVLFVSHNMSAVLRLTHETIVIEAGALIRRAPTPEAVDFYMTSRLLHGGERAWALADVPPTAGPFRPLRLRLRDGLDRTVDRIGWGEPFTVEFEYELTQDITGLRVGLYLFSSRGEQILTSFDTDSSEAYESMLSRPAGRYLSQCRFPAGWLNEGTFVLGVNASSFRIRSYFTDESALMFSVDGVGAPGSQWQEPRGGPLRPALNWQIVGAGE